MSFVSKSFECENPLSGVTPDEATTRMMFGKRLSRKLFGRGIAVESVRYHSAELEEAFAKSGAHDVSVLWDPEDFGAVSVLLDGKWIEVPSVLDWFAGVSIEAWANMSCAMREISDAEQADF